MFAAEVSEMVRDGPKGKGRIVILLLTLGTRGRFLCGDRLDAI